MSRKQKPLLEEWLVERLTEDITTDVDIIMERLAPKGRIPFTVKLSPKERQARLEELDPNGLLQLSQQINTIPDEKERSSKLAELFGYYASSVKKQMVPSGVEQTIPMPGQEATLTDPLLNILSKIKGMEGLEPQLDDGLGQDQEYDDGTDDGLDEQNLQ